MTPLAHGRRDEPSGLVAIRFRLPSTLLHRFRALAAEMLVPPPETCERPDCEACALVDGHLCSTLHGDALRYAAAEAMLAYATMERMDAPPATLVPRLFVDGEVPLEVRDFVRRLAYTSGLSLEDVWHRVVLEFCERQVAPGLDEEVRDGNG